MAKTLSGVSPCTEHDADAVPASIGEPENSSSSGIDQEQAELRRGSYAHPDARLNFARKTLVESATKPRLRVPKGGSTEAVGMETNPSVTQSLARSIDRKLKIINKNIDEGYRLLGVELNRQ